MSSTVTDLTPHTCARCPQPATLVCGDCNDTPGSSCQSTWYCSGQCQKLDWSSHKGVCKHLQSRKMLHRAGATLQIIFYMYREKIFDRLVARTEERDGKFYIHEGVYPKMVIDFEALQEFPTAMFTDPKDKQTVLAFLAGEDASAWMLDMVKYFVKDIASDIVEIMVQPKNPRRQTVAITSAGEEDIVDYDHEVFKIALKNGGSEYALDLSSAQYGYYDPVTPWDEYVQTRVESLGPAPLDNLQPLGRNREKLLKLRETGKVAEKAIYKINGAAFKYLKTATLEWEEDEQETVEKMLRLEPGAFNKKQQDLLEVLDIRLQDFLDYLSEQAAIIKSHVLAGNMKYLRMHGHFEKET